MAAMTARLRRAAPRRALLEPARLAGALALLLLLALPGPAAADEKIRIGIVAGFSGPFAEYGQEFRQAIEVFLAQRGTHVGGREVELLYRDTAGGSPSVAKQLCEELIVRDKVAMIGGFTLSPEVSAAAPVLTETKTPGIVFSGGSPPILRQSPFLVRTSNTLWQAGVSTAEWAVKAGKRRAYISVSDYAPGYDLQEAFTTTFTKGGGAIVGVDHMPLNTVDYAPFAERIVNSKADVVQVFVPIGSPSVALTKALSAQGVLGGKEVTVIGIGETDDPDLRLYDDSVIGMYSAEYYVIDLPNEENRRFKEVLKAKYPDAVPSYVHIMAYDGMALFYRMIEAQAGKPFDGTAAIEAVKGYSWKSPRGVAKIEPDTRDITQDYYIRVVEKVDGHLKNMLVYTIPELKDPWAQLHPLK